MAISVDTTAAVLLEALERLAGITALPDEAIKAVFDSKIHGPHDFDLGDLIYRTLYYSEMLADAYAE